MLLRREADEEHLVLWLHALSTVWASVALRTYASFLALARALAKGPTATFRTAGPITANSLPHNNNGGGGIRTHESLRTPVFKTGALNRSATPPGGQPPAGRKMIQPLPRFNRDRLVSE